MNVYISSHDIGQAKVLASCLESGGHRVVSRWHVNDSPRLPLEEREAWKERWATNSDLIRQADVLVLQTRTERCPGGKFLEAGFAVGSGVRVICVGTVENGLMNVAELVPDEVALLKYLTTG